MANQRIDPGNLQPNPAIDIHEYLDVVISDDIDRLDNARALLDPLLDHEPVEHFRGISGVIADQLRMQQVVPSPNRLKYINGVRAQACMYGLQVATLVPHIEVITIRDLIVRVVDEVARTAFADELADGIFQYGLAALRNQSEVTAKFLEEKPREYKKLKAVGLAAEWVDNEASKWVSEGNKVGKATSARHAQGVRTVLSREYFDGRPSPLSRLKAKLGNTAVSH